MSTVSANALVGMHKRLAAKAKKTLGGAMVVSPPDALRQLYIGANIAFTLDGSESEPFEDDMGHVGVCFKLRKNAPLAGEQPWISWFERWKVVTTNRLELHSAKWSVNWGYPGQRVKSTILRAEWDHSATNSDEPVAAGQPHWHVDRNLMLGSAGLITEAGDTLLHGVSIQRVHLGMSGWHHRKGLPEDDDVCKNWQLAFNGDPNDLYQWAAKTLDYLQSQSNSILPT